MENFDDYGTYRKQKDCVKDSLNRYLDRCATYAEVFLSVLLLTLFLSHYKFIRQFIYYYILKV